MKTRYQILKEVKERMTTGNYDELIKYKSIRNVDKLVILGEKILSENEIYDYYQRVVEIQNKDEYRLKALGILLDDDIYNKLSDSSKQRYLLELSRFYLKLINEYNSQK